MLGGHSGLDPPLPISNRAVKRTSANDSMLFACESRSPPSYLQINKTLLVRVLLFMQLIRTKKAVFYILKRGIVKLSVLK